MLPTNKYILYLYNMLAMKLTINIKIMKNSKTVYGTICNDRYGQFLNATLPSGQVYDVSGQLTNDFKNDYITTVTDADGTEVTIIAKWEK